MLGPGEYQVFLQHRGGERQIARLPWTSLSWAWGVDALTDGSVTVPVSQLTSGVGAQIAKARAWEHENEIGGANRDQYRKPANQTLRPVGQH